jgi:hypothetical protein
VNQVLQDNPHLRELRDLKTFLLFGIKVLKSQRMRTVNSCEDSPQFYLAQQFSEEVSQIIDSLPSSSHVLEFFEDEISAVSKLRNEASQSLQESDLETSKIFFANLQALLDQIRKKNPKSHKDG